MQPQIEEAQQARILRDYRYFSKQHMIFPMNLPKNPDIHNLMMEPIKVLSLKKLLKFQSPFDHLSPSNYDYLRLLLFRICLSKGALQLAHIFNQPPKDIASLNRDVLVLLKYNQIPRMQIARVLDYVLDLGFNATNHIPQECDDVNDINAYIFHKLTKI